MPIVAIVALFVVWKLLFKPPNPYPSQNGTNGVSAQQLALQQRHPQRRRAPLLLVLLFCWIIVPIWLVHWTIRRLRPLPEPVWRLGTDLRGKPVVLSLHESEAGPHAIIVGASGSGKTSALLPLVVPRTVIIAGDLALPLIQDVQRKGGKVWTQNHEFGHVSWDFLAGSDEFVAQKLTKIRPPSQGDTGQYRSILHKAARHALKTMRAQGTPRTPLNLLGELEATQGGRVWEAIKEGWLSYLGNYFEVMGDALGPGMDLEQEMRNDGIAMIAIDKFENPEYAKQTGGAALLDVLRVVNRVPGTRVLIDEGRTLKDLESLEDIFTTGRARHCNVVMAANSHKSIPEEVRGNVSVVLVFGIGGGAYQTLDWAARTCGMDHTGEKLRPEEFIFKGPVGLPVGQCYLMVQGRRVLVKVAAPPPVAERPRQVVDEDEDVEEVFYSLPKVSPWPPSSPAGKTGVLAVANPSPVDGIRESPARVRPPEPWWDHTDPAGLDARRLRQRQTVYSHLRVDEHGCWVSNYSTVKGGYAKVTVADLAANGSVLHKVMWQWLVGPIPLGLTLDHRCAELGRAPANNTGCCNPDHIELVSEQENTRRRHLRGRGLWIVGTGDNAKAVGPSPDGSPPHTDRPSPIPPVGAPHVIDASRRVRPVRPPGPLGDGSRIGAPHQVVYGTTSGGMGFQSAAMNARAAKDDPDV